MISINPKPSPEYRREAGGSPACPLPSTGSGYPHTEREQVEVCVCKGQTAQDTGTDTARGQEHSQVRSQVDPCGIEHRDLTGTRKG